MLAALFLSVHPANAQYVGPVYTGGQASFGGQNYPYGLGSYGYGGGGPGACKCSGGITATFIWAGGSQNVPLPAGVIVEQTGYAYWQGENVPVQPQGACDDGLSDPELDHQQVVQSPWLYLTIGVSQGTHYSTQTPSGNNITLTCTPTASVNATGASSASVYYTASVLPVYIQLAGVTDVNSQDEILAGQLCNATLQLPGGFKCSSCDWSISGTNYSKWNETNAVGPEPTAVTPLNFTYPSPYVSTSTTPNWYWDDTTSTTNPETVSCTADLVAPDGTTFTATFSKKVTELAPTSSMSGTVGTSQILANAYGNGGTWLVLAGSNPKGGYTLNYTVTQPTDFPAPGESAIAQLAVGTFQTTPAPSPPDVSGLDGSFPYPYGGQGVANGSGYLMWDGPGFPLDPYTSVNVSDYFDDYLMYLAPSDSIGQSVWVPLRQLQWNWNAAATEPQGGWGQPVKITGSEQAGSSTLSNSYPTWLTPVTLP